ncbi:MAG: hypothetical protein ACERKV_07190 [Clostridiaceae bacterium]
MKSQQIYDDKIHRYGRITGIMVIVMIILVPIIISITYGIFPPIKNLLIGIGMVCMVYLPISIAEFVTYTPMLGSNASYLVFVTGNLTNLKIPCALSCMDTAGVKPQTEEGEVIAAIAVAVSSMVTTFIVFIGMIASVPLKPILASETLAPAFAYIIPALFGALGAYWIQKQWKLAIVPITLIILAFAFLPIPDGVEGVFIPVMGLISVLSAKQMYRRGFITEFNEKKKE